MPSRWLQPSRLRRPMPVRAAGEERGVAREWADPLRRLACENILQSRWLKHRRLQEPALTVERLALRSLQRKFILIPFGCVPIREAAFAASTFEFVAPACASLLSSMELPIHAKNTKTSRARHFYICSRNAKRPETSNSLRNQWPATSRHMHEFVESRKCRCRFDSS